MKTLNQTSTSSHADIASLAPWAQNIHLPDGTCTAPHLRMGDYPSSQWQQFAADLPSDLSGWTALDVGCGAGFYSVELARRGARVTAIDKDPHVLRQAHWVVEKFGLGSRIELHRGYVYDLAHWALNFDLILFVGTFSRLRYPLLGLDLVAEKTNRLLVFQTATSGHDETLAKKGGPASAEPVISPPISARMTFDDRIQDDGSTIRWTPNLPGVESLLRSAGLAVVARPGAEIFVCQPTMRTPGDRRGWDPEELLSATGTGGIVTTALRRELSHHLNTQTPF